ncbi:MAG TPA: NB-ARC domain-containing protein [Dactylosporangium sp.]|nr:NB-ARC domain-containing protein [Dactylosporangium sp.]
MQRWRLGMLVVSAVIGAAAAALASIAANAATGSEVPWFPSMQRYALWWLALSACAVAGSAVLAWWVQRRYEQGVLALVPVAQRPESWMVDRPAEVARIVAALRRRRGAATVGITTALHGAGGFGKTTVARLVRSDPRVLRRFAGRVYWVTLGRDVRREALLEKINDLVRQVDPARAYPFADVRQAAEHLAAVLADGPRRLVILDDVWFDDQLAAFPVAGRCARLVTTRVQSLVAGQSAPVRVDQMSPEQARRVLTAGLGADPPPAVVDGLLAECGRWPLLLRLANKIMIDLLRSRTDVAAVAEDLLQQLRRGGAAQVDQLTGAARLALDIDDPEQRDDAVTTTIEASVGLLGGDERARLTELSIFAEDETVPVALATSLWQATGGLAPVACRTLCARLADLALISLDPAGDDGSGTFGLHDVVRDYLLRRLGPAAAGTHRTLLTAAAAELPEAPGAGGDGRVTAWWRLPPRARYLREHLIEHVLAAGRAAEARRLATDLRWVQARLDDAGPVAVFVDLALVDDPAAAQLSRRLGRAVHLLGPTDPPHARADILYARVAHGTDWQEQAERLGRERTTAALVCRWPLPDLPHPALRRTLPGHRDGVGAIAISPDGTWLVTTGYDGSARIWDAATGRLRTELVGHRHAVGAAAVSADGTWLLTAGYDGTIRLWDPSTGAPLLLIRHPADEPVTAAAIGPDGTWLVSGQWNGPLRFWDRRSGRSLATLSRRFAWMRSIAIDPRGGALTYAAGQQGAYEIDTRTHQVRSYREQNAHAVAYGRDGNWFVAGGPPWSVAVAPDGRWLATGGDGVVSIWDVDNRRPLRVLTGHRGDVGAVAIAPDGNWLASGADDGTVRIWDAQPDLAPAPLEPTAHGYAIYSVAVAPDGSWLATGGEDGAVRIWDAETGEERSVFSGRHGPVASVAIAPGGGVLASGDNDGSVRIRDAGTGTLVRTLRGHSGAVGAVTYSPDGAWLASVGYDSIHVWDTGSGDLRHELSARVARVASVAASPDGAWLATACQDGSVRIWDAATGAPRHVLLGHRGRVRAVAVATGGGWLASGGNDGSVRIWDAATGESRAVLKGHEGWVRAVAVAPDGRHLASAGDHGTLRVWDVLAGACVALMRVEGVLHACAWDPAGGGLVAGGSRGLYRFGFRAAGAERHAVGAG